MAARGGGGGGRGARGEERRALDEFDELAGLRDGGHGTDGGGARQGQGVYSVEHLATFTVTRETGIVYPADGMRRLLQLEKSNGIWSQKMQLCVEPQWVLVMDYETGVSCLHHSQYIASLLKHSHSQTIRTMSFSNFSCLTTTINRDFFLDSVFLLCRKP